MNDFTEELAKLHQLTGAEYSRQVERIALRKEFHLLETDEDIYSVGGEKTYDYQNLLIAARKAVEFGYKVYMLPNPTETRTPDFILYKKGVYRTYDLKTVYGKASVGDSLLDSVGQCNSILINMTREYSTRKLALAIKHYFVTIPFSTYFAGAKVQSPWQMQNTSKMGWLPNFGNFLTSLTSYFVGFSPTLTHA